MSVDAETYIVISLMFAVFAAVAAVGSSMVLGAGFERLRAGFEIVRRQSGFFSDAIQKLDQRTTRLDEETAKLKSGLSNMDGRVVRVEKQVLFVGDAINSIEQRILQGTPQQEPSKPSIRMQPVSAPTRSIKDEPKVQTGWIATPVREQMNDMPSVQAEPIVSALFRDFPEETPAAYLGSKEAHDYDDMEREPAEAQKPSMGITTLISKYWTGEQSGSSRNVVYH